MASDIIARAMAASALSGGGGGGTPEGTAIKSTGETSGKVLTSNGSGGASWQTAGGGGGSGDVTASGTLTSNCVILGNGTKSVKAMSDGTEGDFLRRGESAPEWKGLYMHTVHFYNADSMDYGPVNVYFMFVSTSSVAIELMTDVPEGIYPATGVYDDSASSGEKCPTVYVDTTNSEVGYINPTNGHIDAMLPWDFTETPVTDTVTQIL